MNDKEFWYSKLRTGMSGFPRPFKTGGFDRSADWRFLRVMYTEGNPVKFRDPSGMSKTGDFWLNMRREITKGFSDAFKSAAKAADHWARDVGRAVKYNKTIEQLSLAYVLSGMTPEAFLFFYAVGKQLGHSETATWFDMNYSGNGNLDPFSKYNNKYTQKEKIRDTFILLSVFREEAAEHGIHYTMDQVLVFFVFMVPLMSPGPKTWADSLGMQHDREVPYSQLEHFESCSVHKQQFQATGNYISGAVKGLVSGEAFKVPINGVIGGVYLGILNLYIDAQIRYRPAIAACVLNGGG